MTFDLNFGGRTGIRQIGRGFFNCRPKATSGAPQVIRMFLKGRGRSACDAVASNEMAGRAARRFT
jgi:hypothetical protein